MPNEYISLNDTKLNIKKSENLIAIIEEKRKDAVTGKDMQSENSLFSELFKAFKDFFSKLGKPTVKKNLLKVGSPARSSDYNDRLQEVYNDLHVAYDETDALSSVIVKDFNYSEADRQMLLNKIRSISSSSTDYSFYSEGAKTQSIYAVDDFTDNSKIDFARTSPGVQSAELAVNQGVVTLKRTGNIDKSGKVIKVDGIKESIPQWNPSAETGGYEGLYFGNRNEPRPEGGQFHVSYSSDGSRVFENGASESEKMPRRLQMFDNNPNTFWEVEYIASPIVGYRDKMGTQISVAEFNNLIANEVSSPNAPTTGGTVTTSHSGSIIENFVPISSSADSEYLTCSFIAYLDQAENVNWISLNPNNFGTELYMEVLSIQTSEDGSAFEELEGFDDHEYELTLTRKANSELTSSEVKDTLSPDKFKYAGQGVWVFAPRKARAIKFDLRQTRSYLKTYEVLMVETQQTVTTTTTKPESGMWWWHEDASTSTSSSTATNQIEIPYLTGHVVGFDVMSLEPGSINTGVSETGPNFGNQVAGAVVGAVVAPAIMGAVLGSAVPVIGTAIGFIVGGLLGWLFGSSGGNETTTQSVSPQSITRQWTKTKNDRSRFALGIRDINIYSYTFAQVSEIVSKPYLSPSPISKVALQVDEQVPTAFYEGSDSVSENDWIKYYISVDNGTSWNRISPTSHKSTMSEDGINYLPEVININSDVTGAERKNPLAYVDTGAPVSSIRFKAVLSRPTNISNAESYTPVLSKYSLQIYPVGGL